MVPSSAANINDAGLPLASLNPPVPLLTWPVGVPFLLSALAPGGIVTTVADGTPAVLYRVERPLAVSDTQNGLVGLADTPQSPFRLGSVLAAPADAVSATRLVWL